MSEGETELLKLTLKGKKLTREQVEQIVREARDKGARPDLREADLRETNLRETDLRGAILSGTNLSRADLTEAHLGWATLIEADLREATLRWTALIEADLSWATLHMANLTGANLSGAILSGTNLNRASLSQADLIATILIEADLRQANLSGADLSGASLIEADLTEANLTEADLTGADLRWADLTGADLTEADLTETDFTEADLRWADLTETNLDRTNFSNTIIGHTSFIGIDLSQVKGLTEVRHHGPSNIDINTIYWSNDKIPKVFLERVGVHSDIIRWQHSLHTLPTVFICYSHKDEKEKDLLVTHLSVLKELGTLDIWDDTQIIGGADWKQEIIKAIARSSVAILLVSANLLTSKIINTLEIPQFIERHSKDKDFLIYPIIIKPCHWEAVPWLNKIEVRPKGGKPIWGGSPKANKELSKIASEVEGIIKDRWWKAFR